MGTRKKGCYSKPTMKPTILALLLSFPLSAGAVDKSQLHVAKIFSLPKLQENYKSQVSLDAEIVQEIYQASLARTKTSKGSLKLAKPHFVRWEIYEPEANVTVSNGRKLWYFTPDARGKGKGQVIVRKAGSLTQQPLFRILTGLARLDQEFKVDKMDEVSGVLPQETWTRLVLVPLKKMGDIKEVELKVSSDYLIHELLTENENGNKTKITLQNQTLGAKLPPALFEFKPPADTEVVQQ